MSIYAMINRIERELVLSGIVLIAIYETVRADIQYIYGWTRYALAF